MKHFRLFAILLLLVCKWTTVAHGQTQEPAINIEFTDIPLSEAISRIEKSSKYTFFYDAKQTDLTLPATLHANQLPISAALRQMLAPTGLDFTISERQIALIPAARKAPAGSRTITGTVNDSHELPLAGAAATFRAAGSSKIPASSGRKAILNSFIMVRKIYFFNAFSMLRSNNS